MVPKAKPKAKVGRLLVKLDILADCFSQPAVTADDVAFLDGILDDVDANPRLPSRAASKKAVKMDNRRKVRLLSPPVDSKRRKLKEEHADVTLPNTPPPESNVDDEGILAPPEDDGDVAMSDPVPSSPTAKAAERKAQGKPQAEAEAGAEAEDEDEDMLEVAQAVGDHAVKVSNINISGSRPVPKIMKKPALPTPESSSPSRAPVAETVDAASWTDVTAKLNVLRSPAQPVAYGKLDLQDALEEDGSLRLFWTDYTEVNGSLCLFGKVQNKKTKAFVSAFVKVDHILRKLFFLPREFKKSKSTISSMLTPC